jgi:hypothetical protein
LRSSRGCGGVFSKRSNNASRRRSVSLLAGGNHVSRKKQKVRDLTGQWPSNEEVGAAQEAFQHGPPIVCAILGAALIEYELEAMLRRRFKHRDDDTWAELTDEHGPLNTFSAKITAGRAFGLYDESVAKNLRIIKDVRNVFAHSKRLITFDEPAIIDFIKSMSLDSKKYTTLYKRLRSGLTKFSGRESFIHLCFAVALILVKRGTNSFIAANRDTKRAQKRRETDKWLSIAASVLLEEPQLRNLLSSPPNQTAYPSATTHAPQQPALGEIAKLFQNKRDKRKDK